MVAMGLSGTRVAALPGVPASASDEIIAGLSGEGGAIGLHLTRVPVSVRPSATRPSTTQAAEAHAAAVRSASARSAASAAHATVVKGRPSLTSPATLSGRQAQQGGTEQVLAVGASGTDPADPGDPSESKTQEKAEQNADAKQAKADSKRSKHSSGDKSY
jgi:hypothetical protein